MKKLFITILLLLACCSIALLPKPLWAAPQQKQTLGIKHSQEQLLPDRRQRLATGQIHSLYLDPQGTVWGWGKLGIPGSNFQVLSPIPLLEDVTTVAAGDFTSFAIKKDHSLWAWGNNYQQGLSANHMDKWLAPSKIMDDVLAVAGGWHIAYVIKTDHSLWGWGDDNSYIGDGKNKRAPEPVHIMDDVASVTSGTWHTLALTRKGALYAWGGNSKGQLGSGKASMKSMLKPQVVSQQNIIKKHGAITSIQARFSKSLAVASDGSAWFWGCDFSLGKMISRKLQPQRASGATKLTNVVALTSSSNNSMLALKKDGTLWFQGTDDYTRKATYHKKNVDWEDFWQIADDVAQVSCGNLFTVFLKNDGSLWAWGNNEFGQLGDGTTENRDKPVRVVFPEKQTKPTE